MTTLEDLEQVCLDHDVAISYLGLTSARSNRSRSWCCTIRPVAAGRWSKEEWAIRGTGINLRGAVEDALTQLSVFLISRSAPPE